MGKNKNNRPKQQMSPSMRREPVAGAEVSRKKRPISTPARDDGDANLVFGLQLLDHDGPYAWAGISSEHTKLIAEACRGWESMRPEEVFAAGGNKPIPFERLCPTAQARLRQIDLEEYDGLWELRVSAKRRIWGIRKRHVFYIVWWDPEHEVCPSSRRHT
jgi:hypothetical protein